MIGRALRAGGMRATAASEDAVQGDGVIRAVGMVGVGAAR
jgi:hypothetical protein